MPTPNYPLPSSAFLREKLVPTLPRYTEMFSRVTGLTLPQPIEVPLNAPCFSFLLLLSVFLPETVKEKVASAIPTPFLLHFFCSLWPPEGALGKNGPPPPLPDTDGFLFDLSD